MWSIYFKLPWFCTWCSGFQDIAAGRFHGIWCVHPFCAEKALNPTKYIKSKKNSRQVFQECLTSTLRRAMDVVYRQRVLIDLCTLYREINTKVVWVTGKEDIFCT